MKTGIVTSGLALLLAIVAGAGVAAAGPADEALLRGLQALREGVDRGDVPALMKARAEFLSATQSDPGRTAAHYDVALADWRLAGMLGGQDEKKRRDAERLADEGVERCDRVLALEGKHADALALKAGLQGLLTVFRPAQVMSLGPAAQANLDRAKEIAPESARVWLFGGINLLHRPAAYGGGADRALAEFEHAQALFAADTANAAPPRADAPPDWGRDEAWAWAGRAHMQLKDPAAAKRCYEKALELNPTNGWVRASLLPAAERALADTTRDAK